MKAPHGYLVDAVIIVMIVIKFNVFINLIKEEKNNKWDDFFMTMSVAYIFARLSVLFFPLTEMQKLTRKAARL